MRFSIQEGDPGYQGWLFAGGHNHTYTVTLNGTVVEHCITADDELGYVKTILKDSDGKIVLTPDMMNVEYCECFGVVVIEVD